jgi:hypothetical protein
VIFDGRKKQVSKQLLTRVIEPRWSQLRQQLFQARKKCKHVGTPADKLAEFDRLIERLDYEWQLVCSREAVSPNPARVGTARDEKAAIRELATHLKANPDLAKIDAAKFCSEQGYELSGRGFQTRVWPRARETSGLAANATAGRKKKIVASKSSHRNDFAQ